MEILTGKRLERARKAAGLSPEQLARAAGLHDRSHVRKIERDLISPQATTLRKIAGAIARAQRAS